MLVCSGNVFVLVSVITIVKCFIKNTHVWLSACIFHMLPKVFLLLTFFNWEEVDLWKFKDFFLFLWVKYFLEDFFFLGLPHVWTEQLECFIRGHWESVIMITVGGSCTILFSSEGWHLGVNKFALVRWYHSGWIQRHPTLIWSSRLRSWHWWRIVVWSLV